MFSPAARNENYEEDKASAPLLVLMSIIFAAYCWYDWSGANQLFELFITVALLAVGIGMSSLRDRSYVRRALLLLSVFAALRFVLWRLFFTLNLTSPANSLASVLLFYAEGYAVLVFLLVCLQNWYLERRPKLPKPDPTFLPSVDVYICTYNEPLHIVRRTACGAKAIDYPNKNVYILDDGRRESISLLAIELDVGYIVRPDNKHAKAGNINSALKETNGEFVLILDADHIPCRTILKKIVSNFQDPEVAIVQTPHRFMNAAPIQRNLYVEGILPHEQEMFFQISMVGKDYWNAAIFAGSAGVIRRKVLDEIGGMCTKTVIEDCEFSLEVHRRGHKSLYLTEPLTIGLCPETLGAYLTQQSRWAKGQTQMLMLANPLAGKGLSIPQRLCYMSGNIHYLFGLARLTFIIMPTLFILLGVCTTTVSWLKYMLYLAPFIVIYTLAQNYTFKNFRHSFWADVYEMVLAPYTLYWTFITLLDPAAPRFDVTPKGLRQGQYYFDLKLVWYHFLLLLWCLFAVVVGLTKMMLGFDLSGNFANLLLCFYNIFVLLCAILVGFERPQMRQVHRVKRRLPVTIVHEDFAAETVAAFSEDASEFGIRLLLEETSLQFKRDQNLALTIGTDDGALIEVTGKIVRMTKERKRYALDIAFDEIDAETRFKLIVAFYCSPETWAVLIEPRDSIILSFTQLVTTPLRVLTYVQRYLRSQTLSILAPEKLYGSKFVPEKLKKLFVPHGAHVTEEVLDPEHMERVAILAVAEEDERLIDHSLDEIGHNGNNGSNGNNGRV
ncbi:MAG: glycosyltransferase [Candidatus Melainabacteria bacterium]|nr:glycosyltransferase [Candidatus Melainabacteria bacterium]